MKMSCLLLAAALFGGCSSMAKVQASSVEIGLESDKIVEGSAFFVTVTSPKAIQSIEATLNGKTLYFHQVNDAKTEFQSLTGIEFGTDIGVKKLLAKICTPDGCKEFDKPVTVVKGEFPSEKLKVAPRMVKPSKKDMIQIARDRKVLAAAYKDSSPTRLWTAPFILPAKDQITSVYGASRVYNGKLASAHLGTDFRAPVGAPITAPTSGRVVLADNLYYTGFTVILDHGHDFFTVYGHMSKLEVKKGQTVKAGDLIGLSGATGRASGPHLHWGVKLNGWKIDPMIVYKVVNERGK